MSNIIKYEICNLNANVTNAFVNGVIMAKSNIKFFDKGSAGDTRAVITFTIRDSKHFFINCTVWGSDSFAESYNLCFAAGDVVTVITPTVQLSNSARSDYSPRTTSPYCLTVNEGKGQLVSFDGARSMYTSLLKVAFKSTTININLADISSFGDKSKSDFVDLLVVVRTLKPTRTISSQYNKEEISCRDVIVMDESMPGMNLTIWNMSILDRSNTWQPMVTVLHLIDILYKYSAFHKTNILSTTNRTLIVENPNTKESKQLATFALNTPIRDFDLVTSGLTNVPDLSTITKVMTVKHILDRAEAVSNDAEDQFTALLYAVITKFDLDGLSPVYTRKCLRCSNSIYRNSEKCENVDCCVLQYDPSSGAHPTKNYSEIYNISLDLTDHTATLNNCHLIGSDAEIVIGRSLEDFKTLSDCAKGQIKWQYLLERCALKLVVRKRTAIRANVFVTIVDCQLADPLVITNKIKVY